MKEITYDFEAYREFQQETGDTVATYGSFESVFREHYNKTEYDWERCRRSGARKASHKTIINSALSDMVGWYKDAMGCAEFVDFSDPDFIASHHAAYIYIYALAAKRKSSKPQKD